ncbi:MAG: hypothetical protein ACR2PX_03725 [Endozoicomonas sp.]|uniref:hypothetical protein n=1 Tax=Endozoicomonas sp. TaxID=1892382 RepID=UPI003D9B5443
MSKQSFDSEEAMENAFEEQMNQLQAEEVERQNEEANMSPECYEPIHNPHKYALLAKQWLNDNPLFLDTETKPPGWVTMPKLWKSAS